MVELCKATVAIFLFEDVDNYRHPDVGSQPGKAGIPFSQQFVYK